MKNVIRTLEKQAESLKKLIDDLKQINRYESANKIEIRYNEYKRAIKILNEETVKRESLIDFLKFHYKDNPIYIEREKFNKDADAYLNQLNE